MKQRVSWTAIAVIKLASAKSKTLEQRISEQTSVIKVNKRELKWYSGVQMTAKCIHKTHEKAR